MMPTILYRYIQQWCQEHGWTDLFVEQCQFWAFPPGSVMPLPIPSYAVAGFYATYTVSGTTRFWQFASVGVALVAMLIAIMTLSPIPLIPAFGFCAIAVALLEPEYRY